MLLVEVNYNLGSDGITVDYYNVFSDLYKACS